MKRNDKFAWQRGVSGKPEGNQGGQCLLFRLMGRRSYKWSAEEERVYRTFTPTFSEQISEGFKHVLIYSYGFLVMAVFLTGLMRVSSAIVGLAQSLGILEGWVDVRDEIILVIVVLFWVIVLPPMLYLHKAGKLN